MRICGIEEAGRGPVIGPMVVCGVLVEEEKEIKLKDLGVKDSKQLTPYKREEFFEKIKKIADDFRIIIVPPKEIDAAVFSDESNLNLLTADKFADVMNSLKPDKAYIDCPSNNTERYTQFLRDRMNVEPELVVEHKADVNYVTVSAASILAKVTRDREIERIQRKYKIQVGSGYPSDPFTRQFLKENYNKYPIFRKSWSSWKNIARKNGQKKLNHF